MDQDQTTPEQAAPQAVEPFDYAWQHLVLDRRFALRAAESYAESLGTLDARRLQVTAQMATYQDRANSLSAALLKLDPQRFAALIEAEREQAS